MTTLAFKQQGKTKGATGAVGGNAEQTSSPSTESFSIPAQDLKGHSSRVGFRVYPEMKRMVAVLVQNAAFGWETDSDFWRWAGYAGWRYASECVKDAKLSNYGRQVKMMMDIVADKQRLLAFEAAFTEVERTYTHLINEGEKEDAEAMVNELRGKIAVMDDDKWRKKWERKFDRKFSHVEVR